MAHRRNKSYLSTCCQKMSLPYQIEETIPEGEVLEGGKKRGSIQQCAFPPMHTWTQTPTYAYTNTPERHGAVDSWQTNDRQMTCWNTSTRSDSNRPVRLCQWHLLWREGRERGLCVILHKQNLCQTPDVIASTAVNCVQSNLSVNLGCREWGHA